MVVIQNEQLLKGFFAVIEQKKILICCLREEKTVAARIWLKGGYAGVYVAQEKRGFLYSPDIVWFFYPLLGWGIGLLLHHLFAVLWIEKTLEEREAKAEYRARDAKQ